MKKYIGIDLGGTNIALGLVLEDGTMIKRHSIPTLAKRSGKDVFHDLIFAVYALLAECGLGLEDIESIGIGVPGTANKETGVLEYANNLNLDGEPFIQILEQTFHKKIKFDNDANAAAWGEYIAGAGKGISSLVLVTLGTGIGGGIILNGKIWEGYNFAAGELGHMVIEANGIPCNCGRKGCFEAYCSASALIEMMKLHMNKNKETLLWKLSFGDLMNVTGKLLFDGVRAGDPVSEEILNHYVDYLAIGFTNIINIFQPELLLIGGGISKASVLFLPSLEKTINKMVYTTNSLKPTKIKAASLENDAGIIGAALMKK